MREAKVRNCRRHQRIFVDTKGKYPSGLVKRVYERTCHGHPFRELMVDVFAWNSHLHDKKTGHARNGFWRTALANHVSEGDDEFVRGVYNSLDEDRGEEPPWTSWLDCHYHVQKRGDTCATATVNQDENTHKGPQESHQRNDTDVNTASPEPSKRKATDELSAEDTNKKAAISQSGSEMGENIKEESIQ